MEGESNPVISRNAYIEKTRHRLSALIHGLLEMQDGVLVQRDDLIRHLCEQEEASRWTGYESIECLCQSMQYCLTKISGGIEKPKRELAISTLLEACRIIVCHADTIAEMATSSKNKEDSDEVCGAVREVGGQAVISN